MIKVIKDITKSSSPKDMNKRIISNNLEMNGLPSRVNLEYILWIMKKIYRPRIQQIHRSTYRIPCILNLIILSFQTLLCLIVNELCLL